MISLNSFEAEITDIADVFIGASRSYSLREGDDPHLYVVLPSFSFKVALTPGNLAVLRAGVDKWLPEQPDGP